MTWEWVGGAVALIATVTAAGRYMQKQIDLERRLSKIEGLLSYHGPEGPAFVHKEMFEMQNKHYEGMLHALDKNFDSLESKVIEMTVLLQALVSKLG